MRFTQIRQILIGLASRMEMFIRSPMEHSDGRFFFTILTLSLLSICLLASFNPYRLLVPSFIFPLPGVDTRKELELSVFSRYKQGLVESKQLLTFTGDLDRRLRLIAIAITKYQSIQSNEKKITRRLDWEALPLFGNALRHVWELPKRHIIINVSSQAIERELQVFDKNNNVQGKQAYYLDAFFTAFVANIFKLEPSVRSLDFFLDGDRRKWPGMNFDLAKRHFVSGVQ